MPVLIILMLLIVSCSDNNTIEPKITSKDMSTIVDMSKDQDVVDQLNDLAGEDMSDEHQIFMNNVSGDLKSCNNLCESEGLACDGMYNLFPLGLLGGFASYDNGTRIGLQCDRVPMLEEDSAKLIEFRCYCR